MGSIIFVHGTGVREVEYAAALHTIRQALGDLSDWQIISCLWGAAHGARLEKDCRSIPDFQNTLLPTALNEQERQLALWAALYQDPLYELRLLELRLPAANRRINQVSVFAQLDPSVQALAHDQALLAELRQGPLSYTWAEAIANITGATEYRNVLTRAASVNTELREAVARALIAEAFALRRRDLPLDPLGGRQREQLVNLIVEALGGRDLGLAEWQIVRKIAGAFTNYVQRRRGQMTTDKFALPGDILLYQARGQQIRDFIAASISNAEPPVVLLGHSLGGIACVDLLNQTELAIELLITVGSQAPFLYEINALTSLPFGEPLRASFPQRWLNIYDPRDFLSYLAGGVFRGPTIHDERVDNGEPFPQAHSAYWSNPQVWAAIRRELP